MNNLNSREQNGNRNRTHACESCDKIFSSKFSLLRHKSSSAHRPSDANRFICNECHKIFLRKSSLTNHLQTHEAVDSFICNECNRAFRRKYCLLRHLRTHQAVDLFECELCHRHFQSEFRLLNHNYKQHAVVSDRAYPFEYCKCANCFMEFSSKNNLIRHIRNRTCHLPKKRGRTKKSQQRKCLMCNAYFRRKVELAEHYKVVHNIELNFEYHFFTSYAEFEQWKSPSYCCEVRWKTSVDIVTRFRCHRSGMYNGETDDTKRKRRLKLAGTKKLQGFCPGEITVRQRLSDECCIVTYQNVHIGHNIDDSDELRHRPMALSKSKKREIIRQLIEGTPVDVILQKIHCANEEDTSHTQRSNLLDQKEVTNIAAEYQVFDKLVDDQPLAVVFGSQPEESALYFKQVEKDYNFEFLRDEDVVFSTLRKNHKEAEEFLEKQQLIIEVDVNDNQSWQVESFSPSEGVVEIFLVYKVEMKECNCYIEPCPFLCDVCKICLHEFVCSCYDSAVEHNMCKHIHAVAIFQQNQKVIDTSSITLSEPALLPVASTEAPTKLLSNYCENKENTAVDAHNIELAKERVQNIFDNVLCAITPQIMPKFEKFFNEYIRPLPAIMDAMNVELPTHLITKKSRSKSRKQRQYYT